MKTYYIALIAAMYVLPILMISSRKINKSRTGYRWVNYMAKFFYNDQLVQITKTLRFKYVVARFVYNNRDKVPYEGKINLFVKTITPYPQIYKKDVKLQVVVIKCGRAEWIPSSNGTVVNNAIKGGKQGNETLYVCRSTDHYREGSIRPSNRSCNVQGTVHQEYELLVHET